MKINWSQMKKVINREDTYRGAGWTFSTCYLTARSMLMEPDGSTYIYPICSPVLYGTVGHTMIGWLKTLSGDASRLDSWTSDGIRLTNDTFVHIIIPDKRSIECFRGVKVDFYADPLREFVVQSNADQFERWMEFKQRRTGNDVPVDLAYIERMITLENETDGTTVLASLDFTSLVPDVPEVYL